MPKKGSHTPLLPIGDPTDPTSLYTYMLRFWEWMRVKSYSDRTTENREVYLRYFIEWCEERGLSQPQEITKPIIERYQRYLFHYRKKGGDPLSTRSQHTRITPVRAYFKWLAKENHTLYNPASDIELPRLERRLPKHVLTQSEAETILNQPDSNTDTGIRDRAIMETIYSTGIRRMEVINLSLHDIDIERGTVMIRQGKGKKD
jgi:integrase/recombinase XerD